ncbi:hypothetical protein Adt_11262 [Abeliophyllum distichum]|uniref:Uncharacterized protein n=1 Tax=Abeliophyllum distichum TaxID=126358 RepID=A0ABD1UNB7_9LAMI
MKPNNLKYEHGKVKLMDFVEVDDFKKLTIDRVARFMMFIGYELPVGVLYRGERMSLLNRLVRIKNMEDVKKMLDGIGNSKFLEVYLVPPARTFVLSWESPTVKWRTNVVIEEIIESDSIKEPDLEKITQPKSQPLSGEEPPIDPESQDAYVPESQEKKWASHEELRPKCEDQGNVSGAPEKSDHIAANEYDNLVDLDYETNEGNENDSQPSAASNVNIDIGLGDLHDEVLQETDTDYGDFDDLKSLESDGEVRSTKSTREFEFNANVDMTNPQFKAGKA